MDSEIHDDVKCMTRLREGDDLALNDLMRRWKGPLVTFALRYTGNATDALEIAQETFVKVYGARFRYRPTSAAFSTWLFSIASNLCKMRARWRSRHPEILTTDCEPTDRDPPPMDTRSIPSAETDRNALAKDLDGAIRKLRHELRVAFVIFEIEGLSYREVAGVIGCTEKAVERRLAKAREQLRSILAPGGSVAALPLPSFFLYRW